MINKLGFGFLRLPKADGAFDWETLCRMTDIFISGGGSYFDTCYTYLNGNSELGIKKCVVDRYAYQQLHGRVVYHDALPPVRHVGKEWPPSF